MTTSAPLTRSASLTTWACSAALLSANSSPVPRTLSVVPATTRASVTALKATQATPGTGLAVCSSPRINVSQMPSVERRRCAAPASRSVSQPATPSPVAPRLSVSLRTIHHAAPVPLANSKETPQTLCWVARPSVVSPMLTVPPASSVTD